MAKERRPNLVVIAGPNGSGKTTLIRRLRTHTWLGGCTYINADDIAEHELKELGGWNSPDAVKRAALLAEERREACLANRESFAFETVFSTDRNFLLALRAVKAGYFTRLFFVGTNHPDINVRRVAGRLKKGGHDVPEDKIRKRYYGSVNNLIHGLSIADRGYVLDNSVDGQDTRLVLRTDQGKLAKIYNADRIDIPPWCMEVLHTLELTPWPDDPEDLERAI